MSREREEAAFAEWMAKVDAIIDDLVGLTSEDLTDVCYRDMYEDGAPPRTAARAAIHASGDA